MTEFEKLKILVDRGYSIYNFDVGDFGLIVRLSGIEGGKLQKETIHIPKTEPRLWEIFLYVRKIFYS